MSLINFPAQTTKCTAMPKCAYDTEQKYFEVPKGLKGLGSKLEHALVVTHKVLDYLPFTHLITAAIDLFFRYVALPCLRESTINRHESIRYLSHQPLSRCLIRLLPLGNFLLLAHDLY